MKITDEALDAAARSRDRYITERFLPDKAIDLIDEAAIEARHRAQSMTPELRELKKRLDELNCEVEAAAAQQDYEAAARLRTEVLSAPGRVRGREGRLGEDAHHRHGRHRARHRRADRVDDRHPGQPHAGGRGREAAAHGGGAARARHRPGRGHRGGVRRDPARPLRPQGPEAADRQLHLPGPHRRRQDGAGAGAGRVTCSTTRTR